MLLVSSSSMIHHPHQIFLVWACLVCAVTARRVQHLPEFIETIADRNDVGEYNSTRSHGLATTLFAFTPASGVPGSHDLLEMTPRSPAWPLQHFQNTWFAATEHLPRVPAKRSRGAVLSGSKDKSELDKRPGNKEESKPDGKPENEKSEPPSPPPSPEKTNIIRNLFLGGAGGWAAYKWAASKKPLLPVVLVHGILDSAANMERPAKWIRDALGRSAYVRSLEVGNGELDSISRPMEWQLSRLAEQIQGDRKLANGFNMIGYSQGSLLARAFVQRYDFPQCHVLVSWVGPQAGQFGVPQYEPLLAKLNHITSGMWYTSYLQQTVSFSNYWRDPTRLDLYKQQSAFLADINNEREVKNSSYAKRLARLEHFVLLHSVTDHIIQPSISSWFGFYKENSTTEIVPLQESKLYTEDHIGLRALDRAGRLHFESCTCPHNGVPSDSCKVQAFDKATRSYLQRERAGTAMMRWMRLQTGKPHPGLKLSREECAGRALGQLEKAQKRNRELEKELARERKRAEAAERELERIR